MKPWQPNGWIASQSTSRARELSAAVEAGKTRISSAPFPCPRHIGSSVLCRPHKRNTNMIVSPLLRAMTLGIGLAVAAGTLIACDDDKSAEQANEKADDAGKTIENSGSTMEEKAEKAADMARDAAQDAGEKISEGAEVAAEEVEKAADAVKEAAQ